MKIIRKKIKIHFVKTSKKVVGKIRVYFVKDIFATRSKFLTSIYVILNNYPKITKMQKLFFIYK